MLHTVLFIVSGLNPSSNANLPAFGKIPFNRFSRLSECNAVWKICATGISAFPMSSRVIARMALKEDPGNFILMQSTSANVSGQLGSIVAGGMVITLVTMLIGG